MNAALCLTRLDERRRQLAMSMAALATRSGVSLPTVQRILSGHHSTASFEAVVAISKALGVEIEVKEGSSAHEFTRANAMEKARKLVKTVQATSALEGQAVTTETINELTDKALHSLLAGSRRKLWAD